MWPGLTRARWPASREPGVLATFLFTRSQTYSRPDRGDKKKIGAPSFFCLQRNRICKTIWLEGGRKPASWETPRRLNHAQLDFVGGSGGGGAGAARVDSIGVASPVAAPRLYY